jgi:hypothetical protein
LASAAKHRILCITGTGMSFDIGAVSGNRHVAWRLAVDLRVRVHPVPLAGGIPPDANGRGRRRHR